MRPKQPPTRWVVESLSLEVKQSGREAHYLPYLIPSFRINGALPPLRYTISGLVRGQIYF